MSGDYDEETLNAFWSTIDEVGRDIATLWHVTTKLINALIGLQYVYIDENGERRYM